MFEMFCGNRAGAFIFECCIINFRGFINSSKKMSSKYLLTQSEEQNGIKHIFSTDFQSKMYSLKDFDISLKFLNKVLSTRYEKSLSKICTYNSAIDDLMGSDIALANIVTTLGGSVRFHDTDIWYNKDNRRFLPQSYTNLFLEVVDASCTPISHSTFEYIANLEKVLYLSLRACPRVDAHCLSVLHHLSPSLRVLDLSDCPLITAESLCSLHSLKELRHLYIRGIPHLRQYTQMHGLLALLEQSLPNCLVHADFDYLTSLQSDTNAVVKSVDKSPEEIENEELNKFLNVLGYNGDFVTMEELRRGLDCPQDNEVKEVPTEDGWLDFDEEYERNRERQKQTEEEK